MTDRSPSSTSADETATALTTAHLYMAAVGVIASSWAGLELLIDASAIALGRIPAHAGFCLTSQVIGPARKLDAYIAIARLRGAERFMKELNEFAKDSMSLAERRNRAVHDPWNFLTTGETMPSRLTITARRILKRERKEVSAPEITRLIRDIEAHIERFEALHDQLMAAIGT